MFQRNLRVKLGKRYAKTFEMDRKSLFTGQYGHWESIAQMKAGLRNLNRFVNLNDHQADT
jgi:hypothetical protein